MKQNILDLLKQNSAVTSLLEMKKGHFRVDDTTGVALMFSALFKQKPDNYLIVSNSLYNAQKISDTIATLIGEDNVLLYPTDDLLRSELISASKEFLAQRIYVLNECLTSKKHIVVAHTSSILTPLPTVEEFKSKSIDVKVGDSIDLDEFKNTLVKSGYIKVNKIDQSLEFASRGDILDIFPITSSNPVRIEFFGDEVDSIHLFDIANQTSISEINEISISPANDCLFTDEELISFRNKLDKQLEKDISSLSPELGKTLKENVELDYEKITSLINHPRVYKYFLYIKKDIRSLTDYVNPKFVFIANEKQFYASEEFLLSEAHTYFRSLFEEGKLLSHLEMYINSDKAFKGYKVIESSPISSSSSDIVFNSRPVAVPKFSLANIDLVLDSYLSQNDKVILTLSNKQQYDTIAHTLKELNIEFEEVKPLEIPNKTIGLALFHLDEGFELTDLKISFISSKELFGYKSGASRFFNKFKEAIIIKNYEELRPGDYVVHENYGIGKFIDIKTMEFQGVHTDFLYIQYAGTNALYIPLSQFRLIRKYAGREGVAPKLSNPDGKSWEKTKSKIKERINDLADRLFKLYSERSQIEGFAFDKDDELQAAFEAEFPFELTKDQQSSLDDIKKDMESPYVMDRLLCGDVGFGKTEVAFRAIFKCIVSNKQAAILCPTTLLARQHNERAVERFANYGIKIVVLSRLVPDKDIKEGLKLIESGQANLVIGTHKLLSKNVHFKDLGLLVVDEEQRFGVEQKERIKELKSAVDVLSLSATPIPRTLQLSLIGVRPVSQIQTAPSIRNSIQTYVTPYRFEVAKELIERELSRRGQVFYVYNYVDSIFQKADRIASAIPTCNVGVVHGQMDKDEIDDTMTRFYNGDIDVLVATSIIENGIDVPNANLIIIEDADRFGLAQLYQIKGRVGRGGRIAYAYLFYREQKNLSDVAIKRLKAIQDFAELGSGFKIAQRDLMIRGAGDILGPEQAGFIDSVGLDLYLKLLNEVIEEKKTGKEHEPPKKVKMFNIDAYIPEGYASKEDKIQLYQQIDECKDFKELGEVKKNIRDIYGRLPEEVKLLFERKRLDLLMDNEEFDDVLEYPDFIEVALSKKFSNINGIGLEMFELLEPYIGKIKMSYHHKELKLRLEKEGDWIRDLSSILDIIHTLYKKRKPKKNEETSE